MEISVSAFMGWLFRPILAPVKRLFRHRCRLNRSGHCLNQCCPVGKMGNPRWFERGGVWYINRNAADMPWFPTPEPITEAQQDAIKDRILYRYKDGYTHNKSLAASLNHGQINGMLREAHRRIQR